MNSRLLGGVLLIIGNCIGGGMLALPIVTAECGFWGATILLVSAWIVMTLGAFYILEVNLWLPENSNLLSMARATLGKTGYVIAWIIYLLLLYSLLAAYIAGGTDILNSLISLTDYHIPEWIISIAFLLFFGIIVSAGIKSVDYVNRGLMILKFLALFLLINFIFPNLHYHTLQQLHPFYMMSAVTVVITSFAFAVIPSLRSYSKSDIKQLRIAILVGSLIPLCCYLIWVGVVLGKVPWGGKYGLSSLKNSDHAVSMLTQSLIWVSHNIWITYLVRLFTSVCVTTSFLAVALSLTDFFADGLRLQKQGYKKWLISLLAFLPPLLLVLFDPAIFIIALGYAGTLCAILLMLLPALMTWKGRYLDSIQSSYRVAGGKLALFLTITSALVVICQEIWTKIDRL